MDFHSLLRRDLQFLCKKNRIPANMTNVAMADSLKALEIVEGLDEYMNQSNANGTHSPTSLAKQPPNTATRTTRRKTAVKADQEPKTNNVKFVEASVAKTPAARTTRKASAATSCSRKVQESKKGELVQSVYSTRRSTRLLEKCMADLSLNTQETLDDNSAKDEEAQEKVSAEEKNSAGSEEIIPGRDLSASLEKEWEILKSDSDQVVEDLQLSVDLGVITVSDANSETNLETTNEVAGDEKESESILVQVDKQEETLQVTSEEGLKKNDNDQEIEGDLGDITVLEYANTETNDDNKESKNVLVFDSLVQVDQEAIQENDSEHEKINNFDEETMVDQTDSDAETEPEEDNSGGVDSDGTISEADSNQAVLGSDIADEEMILSDSEVSAAAAPPPLLEEAKVNPAPSSPVAAESISVQFPRPSKSTSTTPIKNSAMKLVNVDNNNKENNMEMMSVVNDNGNGESKGEVNKKKKKKVEFDEENLKDVSMRQLVKMVKGLYIKSGNNRTALQILSGNNQIAE